MFTQIDTRIFQPRDCGISPVNKVIVSPPCYPSCVGCVLCALHECHILQQAETATALPPAEHMLSGERIRPGAAEQEIVSPWYATGSVPDLTQPQGIMKLETTTISHTVQHD